MNKKIHIIAGLIIAIVLTSTLSVSAGWFAPSVTPPTNNIAIPLNTGASLQSKNGGLSVDNFIASLNSLFVQRAYFKGIVRGATPSDVHSTVKVGIATDASTTDLSVKGAITVADTITSSLLQNTQNATFPLCSDNDGKIGFCSQSQKDYCSNVAGIQSWIPYGMIYEKGGTCKYKDSAVVLTTGGCDFIDKEGISWNVINPTWGITNGAYDQQQYRQGSYWLKVTFNTPPRQDTKVLLRLGSSVPGWKDVWLGYRTFDDKFSIFEGSPLLSVKAKNAAAGSGDDFRPYLPRGIDEIPVPELQNGSGQLPVPLEINVPAGTREVTVPDLFCEAVGGGNKLKVSYLNKIQYKFISTNAADDYNFILSPTFNADISKIQ